MRVDIPVEILQMLRGEVTSIAICWCIEKANGEFIRGTEHDEHIVIEPTGMSPEPDIVGLYPAGANVTASTLQQGTEMSPDNMDVNGAFAQDMTYVDVTVADIEAGLLDQAPVTVFFVNWRAPDDGQVTYKRGFLGEISRDSDGKYTTEVRGLAQLLSQVFIETYSERCVVKRFGDARCKLDLTPYTHTGTVTAVTNRKSFSTDLGLSPAPDFRGADFRFDSGDNADYHREAKSGVGGDFVFWDVFPNDVHIGDTFTVVEACDRQYETCRDRFDNLLNFRGYGIFTPGNDAIAKGSL